jgi:hypothetical protein
MAEIIARFRFKPNRAPEFVTVGEVAEMRFHEVEEVIELCKEFSDAIVDVVANVNGRIISLADQPAAE